MKSSIRISGIYVLFAVVWIIGSDRFVSIVAPDAASYAWFSTVKGLFFVFVTGAMLFFLVRKELRAKNDIIARLDREARIREQLLMELHHRLKNTVQTILSLIHLESLKSISVGQLVEAVEEKIQAMMAVFNTVYDHHDMLAISLRQVLEEYARITGRSVRLEGKPVPGSYTIETVTSCMIVVDSLIDLYFPPIHRLPYAPILISSQLEGALLLRAEDGSPPLPMLPPAETELLDVQLSAIGGRVEHVDGGVLFSFKAL